jgi:hypothetical protein
MYASELRTYGLSAVVSVLLGAGTGFGWHYLDSAGGRAAASAIAPLAQQDAPNPPPSNPPAPLESPVLDVPQSSGLSHAQQTARHNQRANSCCKGCTKGQACGKHQPRR